MEKKQTFKELMGELATLGKQFFSEEIKDVKFADYKAEDGSIIRTEDAEIKVGSKLQVITPEGVMDIPADITEVVLMINDVLTKVIIEGSVVKEIMQPEAAVDPAADPAAEPAQEEMATEDFGAEIATLKERIAKLETALGSSEQAMETATATIAEAAQKIAKQNELNTALFAAIEKMADAPSVEPLSKSKDKFKTEGKKDFLKEFREANFK